MFDFLKKKDAESELPLPPMTPPPMERTSAEILIETVTDFRTKMQTIEDRKAAEYEAAIGDAQMRIANAEDFVKRTGLDRSLPMILQETWHWAAWTKRGEKLDLDKKIGFEVIDGGEMKDGADEKKVLTFRYAGEVYILFFTQHRSYDDGENNYGAIKLVTIEEEVLILMTVSQRIEAEYSDWRYLQVNALIIGPWVGHIIELDEKIKASDEERVRDYTTDSLLNRAKNLPSLGE